MSAEAPVKPSSRASVMIGRGQVYLTVVCLLLGVLLVLQFRTQEKIARSVAADSSTNQAAMISSLYENNLSLRKEVTTLSAQLDEHERSLDKSDLDAMVDNLNKLRIANGLSEVKGPGVEITVVAEIRAEDLQDLINELRNAGAEAIGLNGQRVVAQTAISSLPDGLVIDGVEVALPYSIQAIGSVDTLEKALLRKGGLITYLQTAYPDGKVTVTRVNSLVLPVYKAGYQWKYGQPAK
jgi:uncharacterized protein YlxW (UPF0749 family)